MTVVSHFNKEGKIKYFLLSCIVCEIIQRSIPKDLMIQAAHISRRKNLLAVISSSGGLDNKIRIDILKKRVEPSFISYQFLRALPLNSKINI